MTALAYPSLNIHLTRSCKKFRKEQRRTVQLAKHLKALLFHPFLNTTLILWGGFEVKNLRLPGMLSNMPSSAAFPSQATSAGDEGLNKSPLRVSIITFYLTSTRLWYLAAFDQVYTISVSQ